MCAYAPGVQNISGQLLGQGIESFGRSFARGLEMFQERQEQNKIFQQRIKSLENYIKARPDEFGGEESVKMLLDDDPRVPAIAKYAKLEQTVKNAAAGQQMEEAKLAVQKMKAELDATKAQAAQDKANIAAFQRAMQPVSPMQAAIEAGERFEQLPRGPGALQKQVPTGTMAAERFGQLGGAPTSPGYSQFLGNMMADDTRRVVADARSEVDLARREAAMAKLAQPPAPERGYRYKAGTNNQVQEVIPGGPAELDERVKRDALTKKEMEEADRKRQEVERAASARQELASTLKNVDDAIALVRSGAGGTIAGLPGVRAVNAAVGASGAKTVNALYDSVRAALKLEKLKELKELSRTGGSGLGNLSDAEGRALEQSIAQLDTSNEEDFQLKNLHKIRQHLLKLGGVGQPRQVGRFEVISTSP